MSKRKRRAVTSFNSLQHQSAINTSAEEVSAAADRIRALDPAFHARKRSQGRRGGICVADALAEGHDPDLLLMRHLDVDASSISPKMRVQLLFRLLGDDHALLKSTSKALLTAVFLEMTRIDLAQDAVHATTRQDQFCILQQGTLSCISGEGKERLTRLLGPGDTLGDITLFHPPVIAEPESMFHVQATTPVQLWQIEGRMLRFILNRERKQHNKELRQFFEALPFIRETRVALDDLDTSSTRVVEFRDAITRVLAQGSVMQYKAGEGVKLESERVYIVKEGVLSLDDTLARKGMFFALRTTTSSEVKTDVDRKIIMSDTENDNNGNDIYGCQIGRCTSPSASILCFDFPGQHPQHISTALKHLLIPENDPV